MHYWWMANRNKAYVEPRTTMYRIFIMKHQCNYKEHLYSWNAPIVTNTHSTFSMD